MGFVVLPAQVADISAVYDVYFGAFKDNAITRALFPSVTVEDLTDSESDFRYVASLRIVACPYATAPGRYVEMASLTEPQQRTHCPYLAILADQSHAVHIEMCRHRNRQDCWYGAMGRLHHSK